jgi:hypothetical protein
MFPYALVLAVLVALTATAAGDSKVPQPPDLQPDSGSCDRTTGTLHQTAPCPLGEAQSERNQRSTNGPEDEPTKSAPSKAQ